MTTILAIDQATRISGWAFLDSDNIIEYGIFKTPSKLKGIEAALWQSHAVDEAILLKGIDVLAIEGIHAGKKTSMDVVFLLGQLSGMLMKSTQVYSSRLEIVTSQELCAHIGVSAFSNRKAKKRASRLRAAIDLWEDRTRWTEIPEDAADAIGIGVIVQQRIRIEQMTID